MIRRFIGAAAIVAALAVPTLVQAQGVPGGVERGARDGERAAGPVGAVVGGVIGGVVGGVAASWASMSVPAFAPMWSNSAAHPTSIAKTFGLASSCRKKASPIMTCRRNMASANIATPS